MSDVARVDINIYQGADWAVQIYWTSGDMRPYSVQAPMRMEIRDQLGQVPVVLQTNQTSEDLETNPDNQQILFNPESGLIQLHLTGDETSVLAPGMYDYDLWVHYKSTVGVVAKRAILVGRVIVQGRITQNV